ncbi:nuclear transport factor 2 family protein [Stenotrophomonas maltophilia]|uniref:nuclear transport factor 2 family protein n=1 Tax=Stenotrophomonas maltophilia TaxID=40324 RepID=UPI002893E07A|nr:nuclear transport factor 2 family protein [Stenotrophomonas maltophilia]MDT3501980.1 nuclear transport factor 2 family protein [Stenotrophomonas maltophilia]
MIKQQVFLTEVPYGVTMDAEIRKCEEDLRVAMLAGDVDALDRLIDEDLIFVGPAGEVLGKEDDLALHRSGRQRLDVIDHVTVRSVTREQSAVVLVTTDLSGSLDGAAFRGRFRYCRFWTKSASGWKVSGGSVIDLSTHIIRRQ